MGQGGAESTKGGANSQPEPGPAQLTSSLTSDQTKTRALFKLGNPAYVLKNKNLQHESYSS